MDNCKHYKILGELYTRVIDNIVSDRGTSEITACIDSIIAYKTLNLGEGETSPCMDCDACLTYVETKKLVYGYVMQQKGATWVKEQMHLVNIARATDEVSRHNNSFVLHPEDFVRFPYKQNHKLLVYLDHNILDKYHKNIHNEITKRITPGYADIQYVYSPSHLEEITRMNDYAQEQHVLNTIRKVTSSLFISNFSGNELSLAYEDPDIGLARVLKNPEIARDVENLRVLEIKTMEIFYPDHKDQSYTRELNEERLAKHEYITSVCERFERKEMLDKYGRIRDYAEMKRFMRDMIRALDDIGYKTDKKERTRRSSAHDNEHMKYATGADLFVTMDEKLRDRSQFIYEQLGIRTRVMHWDNYVEYVDSIRFK